MRIVATVGGQHLLISRGGDVKALVDAFANAQVLEYKYSRKEGEPQYLIDTQNVPSFEIKLLAYDDIGYPPGEKLCSGIGADVQKAPTHIEAPSGATEPAPF